MRMGTLQTQDTQSLYGRIGRAVTSISHTVPAGTFPQRIDQYLTALLPESSRAQIQRFILKGHVQVNGSAPKASHRVLPGEVIEVEIPPEPSMGLEAEPIPLSILHEDDHLLVVDKPAGLVVHPAPGHFTGTLVNALLGHGSALSAVAGPFKPGIVHRLDKETSGLLVVAKDDSTHRHLSRQFGRRSVHRVYLAVVRGIVQQDEGTIDAPVGRHPVKRQQMAVQYGDGREAITRYRVLKRFSSATLMELTPQTGRTHQLRVHLAHLGHPILGDRRYGILGGFPRQALHAHRLGFEHPHSGRRVEFVSPLPADLKKSIDTL